MRTCQRSGTRLRRVAGSLSRIVPSLRRAIDCLYDSNTMRKRSVRTCEECRSRILRSCVRSRAASCEACDASMRTRCNRVRSKKRSRHFAKRSTSPPVTILRSTSRTLTSPPPPCSMSFSPCRRTMCTKDPRRGDAGQTKGSQQSMQTSWPGETASVRRTDASAYDAIAPNSHVRKGVDALRCVALRCVKEYSCEKKVQID